MHARTPYGAAIGATYNRQANFIRLLDITIRFVHGR